MGAGGSSAPPEPSSPTVRRTSEIAWRPIRSASRRDVDRLGGVAAVLEVTPRGGEVEHRHAEGVGDEVVDLARDALPLLEHGLTFADRVLTRLGLDAQLLGAHDEADVDGDERRCAVDRGRLDGRRAASDQEGQCAERRGQAHESALPADARGDVTGREDHEQRRDVVLERLHRHQHRGGEAGAQREERPRATEPELLDQPRCDRGGHEDDGQPHVALVAALDDGDDGGDQRRRVDQGGDPQRVLGQTVGDPAAPQAQHEVADIHPSRVGASAAAGIRPRSEVWTASSTPGRSPDCRPSAAVPGLARP